MPDIPQSSQASISQALNQLHQLAPTSEVARQGVEVLVKHLAGNVLSLNKSSVLLNKVVLLNNPEIKGKLVEGQNHQIKLSTSPSPSLNFFSQISPKLSTLISLTEPQLQSLLRLPARQLLPSNQLVSSNTLNKLPEINATVISVPLKDQIPPKVQSNQLKPQTVGNLIETKASVTNQQKFLKLSLTDQRPLIDITLPIKQLDQFTVGEKLTLTISPKGNNWQVTILQNRTGPVNQSKNIPDDSVQLKSQPPVSPSKIVNQRSPQTPQALASVTNTQPHTNNHVRPARDQQSLLSPLLAIPLIKASLRESNLAKQVDFELPIKPVLQQLNKTNNEQNQGLLQKLQALPLDKIALQIKQNGDIGLLVKSTKPVANILVTKEIAQALAPLKLPNHQAVIKQLSLSVENYKQGISSPRLDHAELNFPHKKSDTESIHNYSGDNKAKTLVPSVDGNKSPGTRVSLKEAESKLLTTIQDKPSLQSVISPSLLTNKSEQLNLVQSLLRIVQAKAEAPAGTLQSLEKALGDVEFFKATTEQPSKQLVEQALQQIKQALPQGKEQDVNQIRQLFTTPALNLSALQMVTPTSNQGFMSGLVTLLQMSLSARLTRNQSSRTDHITATLNNVLSGISKGKASITPKAMTDLSQLEQKHQLMKEIGRLLSGHQTNKLSSAEQMIQGQETFYYNLPTALGGSIKDVEMLIKREESNKEQPTGEAQNNKTWQLTMKLAVGEMGELLTKAKLRSDTLELNFYASNETVKIQVMNYLPLLRRKLDSLGIEVSKSQCQLGKIPDTLQHRPYHMFQTKA